MAALWLMGVDFPLSFSSSGMWASRPPETVLKYWRRAAKVRAVWAPMTLNWPEQQGPGVGVNGAAVSDCC